MITARDICPDCSHLWDEHKIPVPVTTQERVTYRKLRFWEIQPKVAGTVRVEVPCGCCRRVAMEVDRRNALDA